MTRFAICPTCGNITEWPDSAFQTIRTCLKCKTKRIQPMAHDRETAERLVKTIGGYHDISPD